MDIDEVPQEGNATLAGERKAVYARDEHGRIVAVASAGWEVEEIATRQAVELLKDQASDALARAKKGTASTLEYWMYERRMDVIMLSQSTGIWQWRVRRHLKPGRFATLPENILNTYAEALGLTVAQLTSLP